MSDSSFDYCILGAGLAGLSLADALTERGRTVCVIEKNEIASGASGTPLGMVNPATGRRATKTWRAEQCYRAIYENLWKVNSYSEKPFFKRNGVLRPALTEKIARKMSDQLKKTEWADGWCQWLSKKEIQEKHPGITCVDGGLWLPIGLTVDVAGYLSALARYIESEGATVIEYAEYEFQENGSGWEITLENAGFGCRNLIFATGFGMTTDLMWEFLPLHPIKGQMAIFRPEEPLSFEHSISSLGYIAHIGNNEYAQGSTYEHDFEELEPDEFGEEYLRNRLKRTLPQLEKTSTLVGQWAGARISTPNRKPVLGRHPERNNLYAYTGLGSKGLMYGKYLANHYAEHLLDGKPLFKEVDIKRFDNN
ncbi:FAD-binding oxidoreductase [Aliifodinibius sp. S!AR15-10]|uniref:NAD(P)/FAD-dependent oxidoreductase n=1 Tax=Aliifodinibius sp. S!AR15-10 TaxID=2950437 RepID=UPI00285F1DBB|nr:FAD-dependent oxidoreductase [Aliifodinibius sp. S!AR15-10]MDR8391845.1 FAD-binding oxidoreductase [Aliifodinibius sp. S!AR15-10]